MNKVVNKDFKLLDQWLSTNRISITVSKMKGVILRRKTKKTECDLNLKLCGKKLQPSNYISI